VATAPANSFELRVDTRKFDRGKSAKSLLSKVPCKVEQVKNEIQLFLQNNQIAHIAPELCRLRNLVVLSLRQS
jgi:hypothetical protein